MDQSVNKAPGNPLVTRYGIGFGFLNAFIGLAILYGSYYLGMDAFLRVTFIERFVPFMMIILLLGGLHLRRRNAGYLTLKEALRFAFLAYIIAELILAIGTYILYNIIDPALTQKSLDLGLEKTREMMEASGMPDEDISKTMEDAKKAPTVTGFKEIFLGTGMNLVIDFVKSLLIAVVIKKDRLPHQQ